METNCLGTDLKANIGRIDFTQKELYIHLDYPAEKFRLNPCQKEPETVEWLAANMKEGDILFDIGANIGAYSLIANEIAGKKGLIYAFEPSFSNYYQLCKNILLNHSSLNIFPISVPLASQTQICNFNYQSLEGGSALHTLGDAVDYKNDKFSPVLSQPALGVSLDDLIFKFGFPAPNLIKIDVDGTELDVLTGANLLLKQDSLKSIIIEICEYKGNLDMIFDIFKNNHWTIQRRYKKKFGVMNIILHRHSNFRTS